MRPTFADMIVTDDRIEPGPTDHEKNADDHRADRSARYQEWRRTRVLFMRSVSEAERAVVDGGDLPAQLRRADP